MGVFPVILLLFFLFYLFSGIAGLIRGNGPWTRAFQQLATRYGGVYSAAKGAKGPAATFLYRDANVKFQCRGRSGPRKDSRVTEFSIEWKDSAPSRPINIELIPKGRPPQMRALRRVLPQPTGSEFLDTEFNVYCSEPIHAFQKLLSNGVRWQINQLKNFKQLANVQIRIDQNTLTVIKHCHVKEPAEVDDLMRFCLELYDQLCLTMTEGIEFRDDMVMSAVDDVRCPICGCDIDGKMVICVRCKTPHCLDCWQYNVKCGMYACDETRYAVVGAE